MRFDPAGVKYKYFALSLLPFPVAQQAGLGQHSPVSQTTLRSSRSSRTKSSSARPLSAHGHVEDEATHPSTSAVLLPRQCHATFWEMSPTGRGHLSTLSQVLSPNCADPTAAARVTVTEPCGHHTLCTPLSSLCARRSPQEGSSVPAPSRRTVLQYSGNHR